MGILRRVNTRAGSVAREVTNEAPVNWSVIRSSTRTCWKFRTTYSFLPRNTMPSPPTRSAPVRPSRATGTTFLLRRSIRHNAPVDCTTIRPRPSEVPTMPLRLNGPEVWMVSEASMPLLHRPGPVPLDYSEYPRFQAGIGEVGGAVPGDGHIVEHRTRSTGIQGCQQLTVPRVHP